LILLSFLCRESRLQKSGKSMHFCDMLIGYARVSTDDQDLTLQRAALKAAGCRRLYEEKISGGKRDRPELVRLLDALRDEDVVVVTRLDVSLRLAPPSERWGEPADVAPVQATVFAAVLVTVACPI
jgi:hypothetical protein